MHLLLLIGGLITAYVLSQLTIFIYTSLTSPLRSVPGPIWTRFSRIWYFYRVYLGRFEHDNIELHKRYGRIVRLAPNMYSIDVPEAVNQIYGISSKMPKSDWYEGWKHPSPDRWTLFPDRNQKRHAETRKRFQNLYSMSSLVSYESYVDECADIFTKRLSEFSDRKETIDMTHWFQCYAFDVIGDITYSKRFGFLDCGDDISGILKALHSAMVYSTLIGIYASLHPYVFAVMNWFGIGGAAGRTHLMGFVSERIRQRKLEREKDEEKVFLGESGKEDFLEKLMKQNDLNPEKTTDYHVFMMGLSNIIAGSDTTAISLSAILYQLLRNPQAMKKLRQEVDIFIADGQCDDTHITFEASQKMPYLQAVMKEALRIHAATGLPLWRVVPEGGIEIDGKFFPAGTVIGLNTWCAHYNETVFGEDAHIFRPERWIEAEEAGGEKLKSMNAYYLPVRIP